MSTLQHINSVIDYSWPEYQRRFPAFSRPEIVPAETLRGMAPAYMRRNIDQDPTSFYMFVKADPLNGDCSREAFKEFIDDLFYEKLEAPSSYDREAGQGGTLTREQAIDKEVLPAARDAEYQRYYDQQMAAAEAKRAEEEKKARADKLGFDPDDPDIIDIGDDGEVAAPGSRAVSQAQTTAVAMPKQIWYAIDFHCPADRMLGYSGGGRLDGRRGSGRYLREAEDKSCNFKIFSAFKWAEQQAQEPLMTVNLECVATPKRVGKKAASIMNDYDLYVFKYENGTSTWVEKDIAAQKYSVTMKHMPPAAAKQMAKNYQIYSFITISASQLRDAFNAADDSRLNESRHEMKLRQDKMLRECYKKKALFQKMLEEACRC